MSKHGDMGCDRCSRRVFFSERKASWADTFDFVLMQPESELVRCSRCTRKAGRLRTNACGTAERRRQWEGVGLR